MPKNESRFTIFFDPPFWVGLYYRQEEDCLSLCKITFGAEPRDNEVYEFLLNHWRELRFSPAVAADDLPAWPVNPKRRQREIRREMEQASAIGTKAQQALQAQREAQKDERTHRQKSTKSLRRNKNFPCGKRSGKKSTRDIKQIKARDGSSAPGLVI